MFLKSLGPFLDSGFDLLTWAGSWACSPGEPFPRRNPVSSKNWLDLDSEYRKPPGFGPEQGWDGLRKKSGLGFKIPSVGFRVEKSPGIG